MSHSIEDDGDQCGDHPLYGELRCIPFERAPVSAFIAGASQIVTKGGSKPASTPVAFD
jgi:hypothetical protein